MKTDEELMKLNVEELREESSKYFRYVRRVDAIITLKEIR